MVEIIEKVKSYRTRYITVTGGEPLAQRSCIELLKLLCDIGYEVSLETSGALDVSLVDKRVVKILDIKTPQSGESTKNYFDNLMVLTPRDQIKFVICNRKDYDWSCEMLKKYQLSKNCEILFSPSHGELPAKELANCKSCEAIVK